MPAEKKENSEHGREERATDKVHGKDGMNRLKVHQSGGGGDIAAMDAQVHKRAQWEAKEPKVKSAVQQLWTE